MNEDRIIETDSGASAVAIVAIIVLAALAVIAYANYRSPAQTDNGTLPQNIDINLGRPAGNGQSPAY